MSESKGTFRGDGLINVLSGAGGQFDRTTQNTYRPDVHRMDSELTALWGSNGLATRICTLQVDDALRPWINVPSDPDGKLLKALDAVRARNTVRDALYWSELYGGSLILLLLKDGSERLEMPLRNPKAELAGMRVIPATREQVSTNETDIQLNQNSKYFGDIETHRINRLDGGQYLAHASRLIKVSGFPAAPSKEIEWRYRFFGISRLQSCFDRMSNYDVTANGMANIIHQLQVGKLTVDGLREILANEDTAEQGFKRLMDSIQASISYLNMVLLGPGEKWERDQPSFAGWKDVSEITKENVATASRYPVSILFQRSSSSGLSSGTSEEEATRRYYADCKSFQEQRIRPIIERIIQHVSPSVGLPPDTPFEWNPMWEPTQKEILEQRKIQADIDKIYLDPGVLQTEEVRDSRFGGNGYSFNTKLDPSYSPQDAEEASMQAALAAAQAAAAKASTGVPVTTVKGAPKTPASIGMPKPRGKA